MRYVFGPVPSRRLGMSLGVDMVPYKTCTFDCVYCECGKTTVKEAVRRQHFESLAPVLDEIEQVLKTGRHLDYITLGGCGEPTLNRKLGELIGQIKAITDIPVAVLTNGSLMTDTEVFRELLLADVVIPSLDAALQPVFERVNRPVGGLSIAKIAEAIGQFVRSCKGSVWLEVLLVEGINDSNESLSALAEVVGRIGPDLVQVGTVERPGTEDWARPVSESVLAEAARRFGPRATIIGQPVRCHAAIAQDDVASSILSLVRRRPCTLEDVESGIGVKRPIVIAKLEELERAGKLTSYVHKNEKFYVGVRPQG